MNLVPVTPGDAVTLRKPHPCGSYDWTVTRTGADIGLECVKCGRRVMLEREVFERRAKSVTRAASPAMHAGVQEATW
jgi:hypothetical protein